MSAALELDDLRCVRGARVLFSGLSAAVRGGQLLRVLGDNGAGKTTLLRTLCGLAAPDRGQVRWHGRPTAASREAFQRQLVYLGHAPALKEDLSALENLLASSALAGRPCAPPDAQAALAGAGLGGRERVPVRLLSQGQRKRAALARLALGDGSGLWVLDEPSSALDQPACVWLQGLMAAQLARGGVVVLTSHQPLASATSGSEVRITLQAPRALDDGGSADEAMESVH